MEWAKMRRLMGADGVWCRRALHREYASHEPWPWEADILSLRCKKEEKSSIYEA
jgi:hypothetical protein